MFEEANRDAAKVLSEETEKTNNATEDMKRVNRSHLRAPFPPPLAFCVLAALCCLFPQTYETT